MISFFDPVINTSFKLSILITLLSFNTSISLVDEVASTLPFFDTFAGEIMKFPDDGK
jgi:hypothetical protein